MSTVTFLFIEGINDLIKRFKSLFLSEGFRKVQLLNLLDILKFHFRMCVHVISWICIISFLFLGLKLSSSQKNDFLTMIKIFYYLYTFCIGISSMIGSEFHFSRFINKFWRKAYFLFLFPLFGGFEMKTYDQAMEYLVLDKIDHWLGQYFFYLLAFVLYTLVYRIYLRQVFENSVTVKSIQDGQVEWQTNKIVDPYIHPVKITREETIGKDSIVTVRFNLAFSWLSIEKSYVCGLESVGDRKSDVERNLSV